MCQFKCGTHVSAAPPLIASLTLVEQPHSRLWYPFKQMYNITPLSSPLNRLRSLSLSMGRETKAMMSRFGVVNYRNVPPKASCLKCFQSVPGCCHPGLGLWTCRAQRKHTEQRPGDMLLFKGIDSLQREVTTLLFLLAKDSGIHFDGRNHSQQHALKSLDKVRRPSNGIVFGPAVYKWVLMSQGEGGWSSRDSGSYRELTSVCRTFISSTAVKA